MDWIKIPFHKKLSPGELEYLTAISLGFDKQLELVSNYIGSAEYAELEYEFAFMDDEGRKLTVTYGFRLLEREKESNDEDGNN